MTPHEVIKDSLEKTEHIIPKIVFEGESVAVDLLKDTSVSLLLSVKEMMETKKRDTTIVNNWEGRPFSGCKTCGGQEECECESYNQALEDLQSLLDSEIEKVSKEKLTFPQK